MSTSINPSQGSLLHPITSAIDPVNLQSLFPATQPVELELGSGDGSFLVTYASLHPEHNFLGIERLYGRLKKIDRKGRRALLRNLKAIRIECAYFIQYLLTPSSIRSIHVYFPDPWPKRKHRQNRLINEAFPKLAARVLESGGIVYLRTDDSDYFEQMRRVFNTSDSLFEEVETPRELKAVVTDFEREFNARGIPTQLAAYRRR